MVLIFFLFESEREIDDYPSTIFCMRYFLIIFWRAFFQEALFKFLPKKVEGENSMQIGPNFPAKSLSIYITSIFVDTFS